LPSALWVILSRIVAEYQNQVCTLNLVAKMTLSKVLLKQFTVDTPIPKELAEPE
jgi:hypothetical protein